MQVPGIDDRDDLSPNEKSELAASKGKEKGAKAKSAAPENKAVQPDETEDK